MNFSCLIPGKYYIRWIRRRILKNQLKINVKQSQVNGISIIIISFEMTILAQKNYSQIAETS